MVLETTPRKSTGRILQAAATAFAENGYHGASIRDISKLCGLQQPSIYHHYGNKENLFRSVLRAAHLRIKRFLIGKTNRSGDLYTEIHSLFRAITDVNGVQKREVRLVFNLVFTAPEGIRREFAERYGEDFENLILQAFRRNPPAADMDVLQSLCIDMLRSLVLSLSSGREYESRLPVFFRSLEFLLK